MKRHIRVAVVSASLAGAFVILLGLGLAGCSSASTQSLTTADNGKSVTLDNGQQMTVELEFQGETGYSWEAVDSAGGVLEQQGEPTTKPTASESPTAVVVGQAEIQVFTFKAEKVGTGTLRLEYKRSWETTVPAEKTWTADVTVE